MGKCNKGCNSLNWVRSSIFFYRFAQEQLYVHKLSLLNISNFSSRSTDGSSQTLLLCYFFNL